MQSKYKLDGVSYIDLICRKGVSVLDRCVFLKGVLLKEPHVFVDSAGLSIALDRVIIELQQDIDYNEAKTGVAYILSEFEESKAVKDEFIKYLDSLSEFDRIMIYGDLL